MLIHHDADSRSPSTGHPIVGKISSCVGSSDELNTFIRDQKHASEELCYNLVAAAKWKLANPGGNLPPAQLSDLQKAEQTLTNQQLLKETKMIPTVDFMKIQCDIARSGQVVHVSHIISTAAAKDVDFPLMIIDQPYCFSMYDCAFEGIKKYAEVGTFLL